MKTILRTLTIMLLSLMMLSSAFERQASAHPFSVSYTTIIFTPEETRFNFSIDDLSLIESIEGIDKNNNNKLDEFELEEEEENIEHWVEEQLAFEMDGHHLPMEFESIELELIGERRMVTFKAVFPPFTPGQTATFIDGHFYEGATHAAYVNFVSIQYGDLQSAVVLQGKSRNWTMVLEENEQFLPELGGDGGLTGEAGSSAGGSSLRPAKQQAYWWSFFRLGMDHILSGFDHLLFLVALLMARQTFKQYVGIITSFTIAHSITLSAAALNWITIPERIIEPIIALSICYVAAENIFRKNISNRWMITFIFGLVHGIGFADILREMTIPTKQLAISLISFNVGIEVIQLTIIAIVLPLLYYIRRFERLKHIFTVISALTIVAGGIWFVERLM